MRPRYICNERARPVFILGYYISQRSKAHVRFCFIACFFFLPPLSEWSPLWPPALLLGVTTPFQPATAVWFSTVTSSSSTEARWRFQENSIQSHNIVFNKTKSLLSTLCVRKFMTSLDKHCMTPWFTGLRWYFGYLSLFQVMHPLWVYLVQFLLWFNLKSDK